MATYYQTDHDEAAHPKHFAPLIDQCCQAAVSKFCKILDSFALFHLSFILLLSLLAISSSFLLILQPTSMIFACSLSLLFLVFFSYLLILFYFEGKKSHEFELIDQTFFQDCKKALPPTLADSQMHQQLATTAENLAARLRKKDLYAMTLPPFVFLEDFVINLRFWLHHRDIITLQERLLTRAVKEHLEMIRLYPSDLEAHSLLAGALIALSYIYQRPSHPSFETSYFLRNLYNKEIYQRQAKNAAERAVEELKILDDLAPNDPWVHAQLANCYCFLGMQEDEIREYEILKNIRCEDKEILLRLGILYFDSGRNAKGLKIYGDLRSIDAKSADILIKRYNAIYQ